MMTFYRIIYLLIPIALFIACDNEPIDFTPREDVPEPAADSLVGSWELVRAELEDATATYILNENSITNEITGTGSDYEMTIAFYSDNVTDFTGSYLQTLTLEMGLSNSSESFTINADDLFTTGSWSRTHTLLSITSDDQTQEIKILNLSSNTLQLQFTRSDLQRLDDLDATLDADYILSFERTR